MHVELSLQTHKVYILEAIRLKIMVIIGKFYQTNIEANMPPLRYGSGAYL